MFRVYRPVTPATEKTAVSVAESRPVRGGAETILIAKITKGCASWPGKRWQTWATKY
jgi:hypothetical protein